MRWLGLLLPLLLLSTLLAAQPALTFPPPKVNPPDKETRETIDERTKQLAARIARLRQLGARDPALADIEIYLKAAQSIVRNNEFYHDSAKGTLAVLDDGLLRASQQGRGDSPWYAINGQTVARAYRSRIDGSLQPYAVTYPHDYGQTRRRYRLDVVLHGRDSGLTEVSFLHRHRPGTAAPKEQSYVRLDLFGRGNNGYRWAGEMDVWEAIENFLAVETGLGRGALIDPARVVLRGFSMGGAGTWHLGLHRPDQFTVLGPGAGFTSTRGYAKLPDPLPSYLDAGLHIYDAADYAENVFNVPVVAYSGEDDPQIAAARTVEARLKPLGLSITHLVAPKLGHQFPAEWQKKAEDEFGKYIDRGRPEYPHKVRFVTYTLRYPSCYWVDLLGLEQHYQQARVEAERQEDGFTVKTANVRALRLALWPGATRETVRVTIDGQKLDDIPPYMARTGELAVYLEKRDGAWAVPLPERLLVDRLRRPQKVSGLQGPIDDAFMAPFLCVRGTGKPWHAGTEAYARANLERFQADWAKFFRGELPVKDDTELTAADLATRHLILFGDPSSNSLIAEVLPRLPLEWTAKTIRFAGQEYAAASHLPVMVFPSPLATDKYVVLNSGHTFSTADFEGSNALLYPRLGDYAILKLAGDAKTPLAHEVATAGLFDDYWRLPARR